MNPLRHTLAVMLVLLSATSALAQSDSWRIGFLDTPSAIHLGVQKLESNVWGTLPTGTGSREVVVQQVLLADGATLGLPAYPSDGVTAEENEVFWTVQLEDINLLHQGDWLCTLSAVFNGRTLSVTSSRPTEFAPVFRVTVVAVRSSGVVESETSTLSGVKNLYR